MGHPAQWERKAGPSTASLRCNDFAQDDTHFSMDPELPMVLFPEHGIETVMHVISQALI